MITRALLPIGLLLLAVSLLVHTSGTPRDARAAWTAASTESGEPTPAPAEIRWDGRLINDDEARRSALGAATRVAISRWHEFATRRGYRIDVDQDERVVLLSDSQRFKRFSTSAALVDRTVSSLAPFTSPGAKPVVVLRASVEDDLNTALKGARALDVDQHLHAYLEDGGRTARREVDARLVEALVQELLASQQPYLSDWITDGIASFVAERSSSRAMVGGEARTLRSVQQDVSQRASEDGWELDLFLLNGGAGGDVMEAEAMAIVAFLHRYHENALGAIVAELGHTQPAEGQPSAELEQRAFARHLGLAGLDQVSEALKKGRNYRP